MTVVFFIYIYKYRNKRSTLVPLRLWSDQAFKYLNEATKFKQKTCDNFFPGAEVFSINYFFI